MTENETSRVHDPEWHITVQRAVGWEDPRNWEQCCIAERLGGSAVEVAGPFIQSHPDTATHTHRVLLWGNANRTGVVWTVTKDSAHRFNPYTGEHADLLRLPLFVEPQQDSPGVNPILTPAEPGADPERDAQTAAGLKWAEAVRAVSLADTGGPVGAQVNKPYVGTFADFLAANPGFVKDPNAPDAPEAVRTYGSSMVFAARVLEEAMKAAIDYAATHHDGERWSNVEECLAPVAAAASTFTAAYMLWWLNS